MSEHQITIHAVLEGEEEVTEGFQRMRESSTDMSREIRSMGREIAVLGSAGRAVGTLAESFGLLSKEQANVVREMGNMTALFGTVVRGLSYITESEKLATIAIHARGVASAFADAMSSGVTKIASGIVSALHAIASSSVMVTLAENARAVATGIANAVANPLAIPIMIAAAAAAAAGIAAYTGAISIPHLQEGGVVYKPTYALIGEKEPEAVAPLSKVTSLIEKALISTLIEKTTTTIIRGPEARKVVNIYISNPVLRNREDMDTMIKALRRGVE
jgi:hypothetical protein